MNRERYPVKVRLDFDKPGKGEKASPTARRLPSGSTLEFTLEPYPLKAFSAAARVQTKRSRWMLPPQMWIRAEDDGFPAEAGGRCGCQWDRRRSERGAEKRYWPMRRRRHRCA